MVALAERDHHPGLRRLGQDHDLLGGLARPADHFLVDGVEGDGARRGHAEVNQRTATDGPGAARALPAHAEKRAEDGGGSEIAEEALLGPGEQQRDGVICDALGRVDIAAGGPERGLEQIECQRGARIGVARFRS